MLGKQGRSKQGEETGWRHRGEPRDERRQAGEAPKTTKRRGGSLEKLHRVQGGEAC